MAAESVQSQARPDTDADTPMLDTSQQQSQQGNASGDANATTNVEDSQKPTRKRLRIDMDATADTSVRKRGKSMFGLVLGTLNKAKDEDRARNNSEAAKKRQLIEQRLQEKLRKETDNVRRAEEAKKDKTIANRKEEDLQLRDSIHKLRRTRHPILAHFLLTSDVIPDVPPASRSPSPSHDPDAPPSSDLHSANGKDTILLGPQRSHPPPLYYLPAVLTPAQEAFIKRRKEKVTITAEAEWTSFVSERATGITEIAGLRERVAEEDARTRSARKEGEGAKATSAQNGTAGGEQSEDVKMEASEDAKPEAQEDVKTEAKETAPVEAQMDVDETGASTEKPQSKGDEVAVSAGTEKKEGEGTAAHVPMQADDDDAVEY